MASWIARDKRGMAQGIAHSSARLGNAIAPMLVLTLMTAFNWRFSFYLLGAMSAVWLVLWYLTYTERPVDHPRITRAELDKLPPPKTRPVDPRGTWMRLYKRMARDLGGVLLLQLDPVADARLDAAVLHAFVPPEHQEGRGVHLGRATACCAGPATSSLRAAIWWPRVWR
ncbi:MFS transporter [Paraburkholderia tuberum]|uniref:MFS transporter n=1 Tax=Paraburkholderia tuberum TaxID=157910 RepID=UPI001FC8AF54|nr:MFS transporter [Paraburkholderia tuberum]